MERCLLVSRLDTSCRTLLTARSIVLWGLGMEFVGFAIVLPILCWTHLVTSPTAKPPSSSSLSLRKTSLLIHPTELQVLPWAVVIGHFVPVALTFYFPPDTLQPIWQSQQFWLIGRLFHPVFTSIVQLLLSIFAVDSRGSDYASAARRNRDVLRQLQSVYTFATSCAILLHLGTLSLAVSSQLFPSVFTERYRAAFDPTAVWIPVPFWDKSAVATVPTGTLYLLQWDVSSLSSKCTPDTDGLVQGNLRVRHCPSLGHCP